MVVVYGIVERLNPIKARLSDAIHQSLTRVLGLPEDKRAQRFIPLAAEDFRFPGGRTDAYTVIEINMMAGRTEQTKKALILDLFDNLSKQVGLDPIDVEITLHEQPPHCWGFRGMTGDAARLGYKLEV